MQASTRSYGLVAWCYDEIAAFYSAGAIARAKWQHLESLRPGERVLYAGVGRGAEALEAARRGVRVSALDVSPAMLRRFERALAGAGLDAELIEADLFDHHVREGYDAVVGHFVLNVFAREPMRRALTHLAAWVRPGGRLFLADFAPPRGSLAARRFARLYYGAVALPARLLGLAAWHPIYDYVPILDRLGFERIERTGIRPLRRGPALYEAIAAQRPSEPAAESPQGSP